MLETTSGGLVIVVDGYWSLTTLASLSHPWRVAHVNDVSSQGMPYPYITDNDGGENGSGLPLVMVPSRLNQKTDQ